MLEDEHRSFIASAQLQTNADVMNLLFNNSKGMQPGPLTAFMRTPDGFFSIVDNETYTTRDLVDGQNVLYFGRDDYSVMRGVHGYKYFSIYNCVALSIANSDLATTLDDVPYDGVGLSVRFCKNERFLCHGRNAPREKKTELVASKGCQNDHFGFSYAGIMSISASGRPCLPWDSTPVIETHRFTQFIGEKLLRFSKLNYSASRGSDGHNIAKIELIYINNSKHLYLDVWNHGTSFGDFLPQSLVGNRNQCRNNRRWPFLVPDPICLVAHRATGRPVFDLCAVPLCASGRGSGPRLHSPPEESAIPSFVCDRRTNHVLHLGPYRDYTSRSYNNYKSICWEFFVSINTIIIVIVAMTLHAASAFVIAKLSLWEERKYLQLLLLNFTSILSGSAYLFYIAYRFIFDLEQLLCILGFQIFQLGAYWNVFSLISLTTDCLIAVYWPLKFRSLLTTKQFLWFNGSSLVSLSTITLVPIYLYGSMRDGFLKATCAFYYAFPPPYQTFTVMMATFLNLSLFVLNIAVFIGVIIALLKRKFLSSQAKINSMRLLKLVFRVLAIVLANTICGSFLTLASIEIIVMSEPLAFLVSTSSLIWNVVIFFVSDEQFRGSVKEVLKSCSCRR